MYSHDMGTDAWGSLPPLPSARADMGVGVVGGDLYMLGGVTTGNTVVNDVDVYRIGLSVWSAEQLTPMPNALCQFGFQGACPRHDGPLLVHQQLCTWVAQELEELLPNCHSIGVFPFECKC